MKDEEISSETEELSTLMDVDKLIHEPARLTILAHLYVVESADFLFIMRQTGLTSGNLSSHMRKLEAAGYIHIKKEFVNRKPHTMVSLTEQGRQAFNDYKDSLTHVLDSLAVIPWIMP
jgi:DNA-binding MarR family transcriptional regulator